MTTDDHALVPHAGRILDDDDDQGYLGHSAVRSSGIHSPPSLIRRRGQYRFLVPLQIVSFFWRLG
jgi:hypothetical protein